ncbi:MAG TPA: MFS transporter [Phycisphaerae bacterium]|nr:MFS transporter [Phycisphaerae bacterium]HRY67561.1 MFS transporter [Phycisphaerae bacterium]HSA24948.1 MFS transporter [Phycisphaerae bacterium]
MPGARGALMLAAAVNLFRPAAFAERRVPAAEVEGQYRYWRRRILYASLIGYALFYLVRKNLSLAMPMMEKDLGVTKSDLGLFLTLHGVFYGFSKFANGFLGDRTNPRYFMALGLVLSAVMNLCFGLSSAVYTLGFFWLLNGWFQGMGFPPCARSLTHWFAPEERGTRFAIWNTSHSIGAAAALLLCSVLVGADWRLCFLVPAILAIGGAVFLVERLRDTPPSVGLPPIEEYGQVPTGGFPVQPVASTGGDGPDLCPVEQVGCGPVTEDGDLWRFTVRQVFLNPLIWTVSVANFFVYTIRYAVLDWGPTILAEMKGIKLQHAGWTVAGYEVAGVFGMLLGGWLTDRVFRSHGGRTCLVYMVMCTVFVALFWKLASHSAVANAALLCAMGFCIYGPQCLVGVIAANLATQRAAATAIGLTGLFGYMSGVLSGWGLGYLAEHTGWSSVFGLLMVSGLMASILFALCWNAGHGPGENRAAGPAR